MTTSDEPRADEGRSRRSLVAALMSGFVGALALAVSTYNVYLQHKQVRAQVWPRLNWGPSWNSGVFTYDLENGGIGPAEIMSVRVFVDDKPVSDWHEVLLRMTGKDLASGGWGWSTMNGAILTPATTKHPLEVHDAAVSEVMFRQQRRLRAEICYCSALEDCWELVGNERPRPIAKCPSYPQPFED